MVDAETGSPIVVENGEAAQTPTISSSKKKTGPRGPPREKPLPDTDPVGYKLSRDTKPSDPAASDIDRSGKVTEYNFTQIEKYTWQRQILDKLRPTIQEELKKWDADRALFNTRIRKDIENGHPLYELLVAEDITDDPDVLMIRMRTTNGSLFARVDGASTEWLDFVQWLTVEKAAWKGLKQTRDGVWEGYGVFDVEDESAIEDLLQDLQRANQVLNDNSCLAIWEVDPWWSMDLDDMRPEKEST